MKIAFRGARSSATLGALGVLVLGLTSACSQQSTATQLRSLQSSGDMSFLCLSHDPDDDVVIRAEGREFCPDFDHEDADVPQHRRLHAMVTQPETGEVALVDLYGLNPIDSEPTQPGYNFISVGAEPGAIVSTPGGQATFVGVRESGRPGIFGLPTSCIGQRPENEPLRDITSLPACRLPAAPGPMELLLDPGVDDDGDPNTPPLVRERCEADYSEPDSLIGRSPGATRTLCPADLALEGKPYGRRKLAVALPSYREIWILDAQELLDREPGTFQACVPEQRVVLDVASDAPEQPLPPDLVPPAASCGPVGMSYGPPGTFTPYPTDFAVDDRQRLYVADGEAPLIHVLDAANPCSLQALPPLHTSSYLDPNAVITTSKVAASALTPLGKRFVYAVDSSSSATAGSVIPFDVSPSASTRRPLIRERSTWTPFEPPDRIVFPQDVSDVEFMFRDVPALENNVAIDGIACEPDPRRSDEIGARYRPSDDRLTGAAPRKLRGTFGLAALHSGRIGVIDVEDLDAACRRPLGANRGASENDRGCANDPEVPLDKYQELNGLATVSGELSCNVVEPHRVRSQSFFVNAIDGTRAGALRAFPTLALETGRAVATDQSIEGRNLPRMLAARQTPDQTATLVVGDFGYSTSDPAGVRLELDPNLATRSSVLVSFNEPRAFSPNEDFAATYEGLIGANGQAYVVADSDGFLRIDEGVNGSFCEGGVQDQDLTREVGAGLGVSAQNLDAFARRHADYVQIVDDLLDEDDTYWSTGNPGATCGVALFEGDESASGGGGRALCEDFFGPSQLQNTTRDLRVVEASETTLRLEPRILAPAATSQRRQQLSEFVSCCFPRSLRFGVRAGNQWVVQGSSTGFAHHVKADPTTGRCVSDCNPLTSRLSGRTFEISCSGDCAVLPGEAQPVVGLADPEQDFACVVDDVSGGIDPGERGSECVFQSLTTRFAIYRGRQPSTRNMRFRWQLVGGFEPFLLNLSTLDRISSPRTLIYNGELDRVFFSDGTSRGLSYVTLRNFQMQTIY
jgi:hypothetical protein